MASTRRTQCGRQDRVVTVSLMRWRGRLPAWAQRCCDAWVVALGDLDARIGLADRALAQWRAIVIEDVGQQVDALAGDAQRLRAVEVAWAEWYPVWVAARIEHERGRREELFWSEAEARERQAVRDRAVDAAWRATQHRAVSQSHRAGALLALLASADGQMLRWEPAALARRLTPRGPLVDVASLADLLVRAGAAEWRRRPDGRPWALLATGRWAAVDAVDVLWDPEPDPLESGWSVTERARDVFAHGFQPLKM